MTSSAYTIRLLTINDYNNGFFETLDQLTDSIKPTESAFRDFFDILPNNIKVWVIEYNGIIIGTGKLVFEPKFTHGLSYIAHVEDIVIDNNYKNQGLGKQLIIFLIKQCTHCYKIILNCSADNIPFYTKCGFILKDHQMAIYL